MPLKWGKGETSAEKGSGTLTRRARSSASENLVRRRDLVLRRRLGDVRPFTGVYCVYSMYWRPPRAGNEAQGPAGTRNATDQRATKC